MLEKQVGPIEGLTTYDGSADRLPPRTPEFLLSVRQDVLRMHTEVAQIVPCARTSSILEDPPRHTR